MIKMERHAVRNQAERECIINGRVSPSSISFLISCKPWGRRDPCHASQSAKLEAQGLAGFIQFGDCPLSFRQSLGGEWRGCGATLIYSEPLMDSAGESLHLTGPEPVLFSWALQGTSLLSSEGF